MNELIAIVTALFLLLGTTLFILLIVLAVRRDCAVEGELSRRRLRFKTTPQRRARR